ncbi:MAG: electron transfer flavoprotein subunit beta/FixA family protein [Candidatus Aminicenantes bacterium]
MKIAVCIKWIPDTAEKLELREDKKWIAAAGIDFTMNRVDQCAVEKAIRIKEARGDEDEIVVFSLGPSEASEGIKMAMAMGADCGVLLTTDEEGWDANCTAEALASALESRDFDLILFGHESGDMSNCQTGLRVAHRLNLPCVSRIRDLEIFEESASCKRETEAGLEIYKVKLPAVFTTLGAVLATPRYPSLRGIMGAKKKEIEEIKVNKGTPQLEIIELEKITNERKGEILGDDKKSAVSNLMKKLSEKGLLKG